jgi:hypothetical protein
MSRHLWATPLAAVLLAGAAAGCGFGPGHKSLDSTQPTTPAATTYVTARGYIAAATPSSATTTPTTVAPTTTTTTTIPPTTTTMAPNVIATVTAPGVALPTVPSGSVLEVGDSVSIDAEPYLQASGVVVNGMVGRQFSTGISVVAAIAAAHQLPATLVVALGANGTVTAEEIDQMVQTAVGAHHIVFVDVDVPRSWEVGDNAALLAAPARYPGLVTVADWHTVAAGHPEWFTPDQVHLQPTGARALASLILAAVAT